MSPTTRSTAGLPRASTRAERHVTIFVALVGIALAVGCGLHAGAGWAGWQWAVIIFVAFDLAGGVASMPLPPSLKKIRVPEQPLRPIAFTAFHIHPFLIALTIPTQEWLPMVALYASALAGVIFMPRIRSAFAASIALSWCACTIALVWTLGVTHGLEWLAPTYLLKLVGSYTVTVGREQ